MKTFKVKCTKGLPAIASSGEAGIQSSLPVIKLPYAQLFHLSSLFRNAVHHTDIFLRWINLTLMRQ
jgi:hypothetical protein